MREPEREYLIQGGFLGLTLGRATLEKQFRSTLTSFHPPKEVLSSRGTNIHSAHRIPTKNGILSNFIHIFVFFFAQQNSGSVLFSCSVLRFVISVERNGHRF